jgi:hypothetical protein
MTKLETIEWLKSIKDKYINGGDEWYDNRCRQAIDYAIDMLHNADVESARGHWEYGNGYQDGKADAMASIVRCKDCKKCSYDTMFGTRWCNGCRVKADDFCSDGERREGE